MNCNSMNKVVPDWLQTSALLVALAMIAPSTFAAGPWYVDVNDPNAADTLVAGRGSEALPFRTIQAALNNSGFAAGDTVYVRPGVYDEGETVDPTYGMTNRVYITKKVILKATGNRDNTFIVGRHATVPIDSQSLGLGDDAVRCICVNGASGTVIEGFTLLDGAAKAVQNYNDGRGGGVMVYSYKKDVYVVDCAFVNCVARQGGGMYGGVAVRSLFDRCASIEPGASICYAWGFACVMTGCHGNYNVANNVMAINCTICCNQYALQSSTTCKAYNCVIAQTTENERAGGTNKSTWENSTRTADEGAYQVFSPATYDWRLVEGTGAIGLGTTNHWALLEGVPADYLKYDYNGKAWAPDENGVINAGAVQEVATAATARITFSACVELDGTFRTNTLWLCSDVWPTQYLVKPVVPEGKTFYCYDRTKLTINNWEPTLVYPETNGTLRITPPHVSTLATMTYTAKYAADEIWVDPSAAGSDTTGDGTELAPYQTLQKAVDAVDTDYTIIHAKRGDYASGGNTWSNFLNRVDFYTGKNDMHILLRAEEGSAVTAICGASDATTLADPYEPGCGPDAARCVLLGRYAAVQGFTLKGGRTLDKDTVSVGGTSDPVKNGAAVFQYYTSWHPSGQILDCVITNCIGVDSVMYWGMANRCRFVGNSARNTIFNRGIQAASLVHDNTCLGYLVNNTFTYMCTFANNTKHPAVTDFVNWYGVSCVYDSVFLGGYVIRTAKADFGNYVWAQSSTANLAATSYNMDPLLADVAHGDYRPFFFSPAIGGCPTPVVDGCLTNDEFCVYVGSDLAGGPLAFGADGNLSAGCYQSCLPSAYLLADKSGTTTTNVLECGEVAALEIVPGAIPAWKQGSLTLRDGRVEITWVGRGSPFQFKASVDGAGTLTAIANGVALGTVDASGGEQGFSFANAGGANSLSLVFSGSGAAMVSGFKNNEGMTISFR